MKTSKDYENKNYLNYVKEISPKTNQRRSLLRAFLVGGLICAIGQTFRYILEYGIGLKGDELSSYVSMIMIFLGFWKREKGLLRQKQYWCTRQRV